MEKAGRGRDTKQVSVDPLRRAMNSVLWLKLVTKTGSCLKVRKTMWVTTPPQLWAFRAYMFIQLVSDRLIFITGNVVFFIFLLWLKTIPIVRTELMVLIVKLKSTMQKTCCFVNLSLHSILVFTADYFILWNSFFHLVSFIFHSPFKIPKAKLHNLLSFQEALSPFWIGLSFPKEVMQICISELYFVTLFLYESSFPCTTF